MKKLILAVSMAGVLSACTSAQIQQAQGALGGVLQSTGVTGETKVNNATKGASLGALAGVVAGSVGGDGSAKRRRNAGLAGLAIGGLTGWFLDQKEAQLKAELAGTGVTVERDQEGRLILNMPAVTFSTNSANLSPQLYPALNSVATVIKQDLVAVIQGHTDSTGDAAYNKQLSLKRANSVYSYLVAQGVNSADMAAEGYGSEYPIADNSTAQGRQANRRVMIVIGQKS